MASTPYTQYTVSITPFQSSNTTMKIRIKNIINKTCPDAKMVDLLDLLDYNAYNDPENYIVLSYAQRETLINITDPDWTQLEAFIERYDEQQEDKTTFLQRY